MSIIEIKVPSPGESITEVVISRWIKKDGEYCQERQMVAGVDSEKSTVTVSAAQSGALKK